MTRRSNIATVILCLLMAQSSLLATPYWTEAELEQARLENNSDQLPRSFETGIRVPHQTLDEIAYFVKYRQLCDFLAGMQVTTAGPNFGGMSGVVYGLIGYAWIRGKLNPASGIGLDQRSLIFSLVWLVACFTGVLGAVANYAHLGGLILGMALGALAAWHAQRNPE